MKIESPKKKLFDLKKCKMIQTEKDIYDNSKLLSTYPKTSYHTED